MNTTNGTPSPSPFTRRRYAVGIGIVCIVEVLLRDVFLPSQPNGDYITIAVGVEWLLAGFFAFYWIPKVEGGGLHSVRWSKFRWRHIWLGSTIFIVQLIVTMVVSGALHAAGLSTLQDLQPILKTYSAVTLAALFTAGFLEELFYRAYLIERVTSLTGRRWVALLVSWLSYTLVHLNFFGVGPTIEVSVLSASLVLVYAKERSIWPCLVIHGINSLFAYVLFPAYG